MLIQQLQPLIKNMQIKTQLFFFYIVDSNPCTLLAHTFMPLTKLQCRDINSLFLQSSDESVQVNLLLSINLRFQDVFIIKTRHKISISAMQLFFYVWVECCTLICMVELQITTVPWKLIYSYHDEMKLFSTTPDLVQYLQI